MRGKSGKFVFQQVHCWSTALTITLGDTPLWPWASDVQLDFNKLLSIYLHWNKWKLNVINLSITSLQLWNGNCPSCLKGILPEILKCFDREAIGSVHVILNRNMKFPQLMCWINIVFSFSQYSGLWAKWKPGMDGIFNVLNKYSSGYSSGYAFFKLKSQYYL